MKKLNLNKWRVLRALVEKEGRRGWYQHLGVPGPLEWWESTTLTLIALEKTKSPDAEALRARALSPDPRVRGLITEEEGKKLVALLDSTSVTALDAKKRKMLDGDVMLELGRLSSPGRVFKAADFKGGAAFPVTWLYAMRAHHRGRVHFHGKTLEEQAALLERATAQAPLLLGALMEEVAESMVDAAQ